MIRVILGSPRHLQERWVRDYQQEILNGPTFAPNETLSHYLHNLLQGKIYPLPRITTLWDYARFRLPQDANVAPIGMEHALALVLARDLGRELPRQIPGLYLNIIRHALELRRQHVQLPSFDGIPWPRILTWLEDIWPDELYDEFRVYHYAATVPIEPTNTSSVAVYGYVEAHESQWQLFDELSHHHSITVYTPWLTSNENILTENWVKRWQKSGASTEILHYELPQPRQRLVKVRSGTLMLQTVIEEIKAHQDQDVLLALNGINGTPLVRLAKRRGVHLAQPHPVLYAAKNLWQAFWRLALAEKDQTDLLLWLEAIKDRHDRGQALEFLTKWSERFRRIRTWQDVNELIGDAAAFHDREELTSSLRACSQWGIYDRWNIVPDPDLVHDLLALLPFTTPYTIKGNIAWAQGVNARGLGAEVIIVAALKEGIFPRQISARSLWIPELAELYHLPGPDHLRQQDLHLLHLLKESANQEISWMVAAEDETWMWYVGEHDGMIRQQGPELLYPDVPGTNREHIISHYQSHYDEEILDAYQGVIGPEFGEILWPSGFTATQLERFGTCPLTYFYEYILGIAPVVRDPEGGISPGEKGQWMHKVLEEAVQWEKDLTTQEMRDLIDRVVRRFPPSHTALKALVHHHKEDMLRDLLQAWPLIRPEEGVRTVTEYPVHGEVTTDFGFWSFRGRMDRLDQSENGTVTIMDYKTGTVKNPNQLTADNLQLPLYYEFVKAQFPGKSFRAKIQGITAGNQFLTRDLNPEEIVPGSFQKLVTGMARRIREGDFLPLPRQDQDPCRICPFTLLCPQEIKTIRRRKNAPDLEYWRLWDDET